MKNLKKAVAFLLAFVMMILASGCTKKTDDNVKTGDETTKILWYTFGSKQPDHDLVMTEINKILKEKLNAELQLNLIDMGSYESKMNLSISANENFDICFTSNWLNKYVPNVLKGAYLPLDDLIAKNAPKLKSELPEMVLDIAKYKGQSYAVPNYQILYSQYGFVIQKELADKYNLDTESLNSVQDIEPFLQQIKDNEPGIIPIRTQSYDRFREYYEEVDPVPVYVKKGDESLTAVARVLAPEARETAAFLADWFKKGFIRKDILTVTDDTVDVAANKYAVQLASVKPGVEGEMFLKTKKEYISVPFMEPYIGSLSGMSTMLAISKNCKNPEIAIKLIELVNTDKEFYNLLCFGIEGKHYEKISDDQIKVPEDSNYKMGSGAWAFGNQFNALYMDTQKVGSWEETDKINKESVVSPFRGFMLDTDPIKTELAQLLAVSQEYKDDTIFARADWEKAYDEYAQKSQRAGLDKVVAEVQRQLDEYKAAK